MSNLSEQSVWEAFINQLETNDPLLGGEGGVLNTATRQLANRTQWLRDMLFKAPWANGVQSIEAPTTINSTHIGKMLLVTGDSSGGNNSVISLPNAASFSGNFVHLYHNRNFNTAGDSGNFIYDVVPAGSEQINVLGRNYNRVSLKTRQSFYLFSTGTGWILYGDSPFFDVGKVDIFTVQNVPNGWLPCNGQAVSRNNFADLFSVIGTQFGVGNGTTTFNLPDFRGEFLRGWDNGRGIDPGRNIGTFQNQAIQSHEHGIKTEIVQRGTGANVTVLNSSNPVGAFTDPVGGAETRPRNIAVQFCIKF